MALLTLRNSRQLGDYLRPYIVAEINTSHFGNVDTAKEMVRKAKEVGCDCVKFQSWSSESLYSKNYYDQNPIAKRFVEKFSFSEPELLELAKFSKEIGVDFASTPYAKSEVDFLLNVCKVPYIKVASMDLNNYPFLEYIAKTGTPIVLSTGMGDIAEITKAVNVIEGAGNRSICILHCTSIYPSEPSILRLKNISGLRATFPNYPIGFSDHSLGIEMASAATALGACLIEKHFTLDSKKIGMDNQMATEPTEMKKLVQDCINVQIAMGGEERILHPQELEQREVMRRSIVASHDLKAGSVLTLADLDLKRPGTGFSPNHLGQVIGQKLLRDIEKDSLIMDVDISSSNT